MITEYTVKNRLDITKSVIIGKRVKPSLSPLYAVVKGAKGKVLAYGKIETNQEMVTSHEVTEYATEKEWLKALSLLGIDPYADDEVTAIKEMEV